MSVSKTFFELDFLHNVQKYRDAVVGIKLSGKCLDDFETRLNIVRQVIELRTLGSRVVVIHGGGKQITEECKKEGIEKVEKLGLRYTTKPELAIMERCVPELTRQLVADFGEVANHMKLNIPTIGMNGSDGKIVTAELHSADFEGSRTGKVSSVNAQAFRSLMESHVVVLNSICAGDDGENWNVNADDVMRDVASAVNAKLVIMCSDTPLYYPDKKVIEHLYTDAIDGFYKDGTFNDTIRPKVEAGRSIADKFCPVAIVNGADPNAIERELYTEQGGGTRIECRPSPSM